ncbi:hypothetical protein GBF38_017508 [Nibea albiflora]|uniref:Uncharacterized protein n=1 Tax=Nibea albiflora TaxID=240163 RepID=A0ACB7FMK5_NIBAL|nr:hypothetical protein GBF38_017508 [Nibea albiflora]
MMTRTDSSTAELEDKEAVEEEVISRGQHEQIPNQEFEGGLAVYDQPKGCLSAFGCTLEYRKTILEGHGPVDVPEVTGYSTTELINPMLHEGGIPWHGQAQDCRIKPTVSLGRVFVGKFFLTRTEGRRTEGVTPCTDCKAL